MDGAGGRIDTRTSPLRSQHSKLKRKNEVTNRDEKVQETAKGRSIQVL